MKPLCIYHGNCADGFAGAWVVWTYFKGEVELYPGVYQSEPPDVTNRDLILVDFSYKRNVIEEMKLKAKSITIIDHHASAIQNLADVSDIEKYFDITLSGSMLAWNYYFPKESAPALLKHIQDRDLWKFELPGTRQIQATLFSYPYDMILWDKMMNDKSYISKLYMEGIAIERKHFKDVEELIRVTTRIMEVDGHTVPIANLPYTLTSDAGAALVDLYKTSFAGCYWDTPDGRVFSLRSKEPDGENVASIAEKFGGGGHKHASGFRIKWDTTEPSQIKLLR